MKNQIHKFKINYILQAWCLVACNKINRPGVRLEFRLANRELLFLSRISFVVLAAPGSLLTYLILFIMLKQQVKDNIVYDSYNDVTWNFEKFFELLADYYNGNVQEMSEQLISAIETLMYMQDDSVIEPMVKSSALNLLTVRELLQGIEHEVLEN